MIHMHANRMRTMLVLVALAGILFSGYLTAGKLFTGSCPITEGCPYFIGWPACVYGLLMFSGILIAAFLYTRTKNDEKKSAYLNYAGWIAVAGILFSGYFSATEILFPSCAIKPCTYTLILPTCVYGLAMYILAWVLVQKLKKN